MPNKLLIRQFARPFEIITAIVILFAAGLPVADDCTGDCTGACRSGTARTGQRTFKNRRS